MPDEEVDRTATQEIHLDEGELFSQLCCVTNIVKEGPRHGLFTSHVNMSDGVIRVWRDWLAHRASGPATRDESEQFRIDDEGILWDGASKSIGLRFRAISEPSERVPLISGPSDDIPVSYTLVYEGELYLGRDE